MNIVTNELLLRQALDKVGANNIDATEADKYFTLYKIHEGRRNLLMKSITPEVLTGDADTPNELVSCDVLLYRGS